MAKKLGLKSYDKPLTAALLQLMVESEADFTNTFRAITDMSFDSWEVRGETVGLHLASPFPLPDLRRDYLKEESHTH